MSVIDRFKERTHSDWDLWLIIVLVTVALTCVGIRLKSDSGVTCIPAAQVEEWRRAHPYCTIKNIESMGYASGGEGNHVEIRWVGSLEQPEREE